MVLIRGERGAAVMCLGARGCVRPLCNYAVLQ